MDGPVRDIDVAIMGAGIHGAALFQELCAQGVKCIIGDASDYGAGFSVAGTRILNDGMAFADAGAADAIAQAARARQALMRAAPHAITPIEADILLMEQGERPASLMWKQWSQRGDPHGLGARAAKRVVARLRQVMPASNAADLISAEALRAAVPALSQSVKAAVRLRLARIEAPERLVWELVRNGLDCEPGAAAYNHAALIARQGALLSVQPHVGEAFQIRPRLVVNSAGPWVDYINVHLGFATKYLRHVKRAYLLLDQPELVAQLHGRAIGLEATPGKLCFAYDHFGQLLIGAEEYDTVGPALVTCSNRDIDTLLDAARVMFPTTPIRREDVRFVFAGLRPYPAEHKDPSRQGLLGRVGRLFEAEAVPDRPFPVLSIAGGTWSDHQILVKQAADRVLALLERARQPVREDDPIGGGWNYPEDAEKWVARTAKDTGLDKSRVAILFHRYGTVARAVAAYEATHSRTPVCGSYTKAEIAWIARHEHVRHLDDLVLRRTTLAISGLVTAEDLSIVAGVVAGVLGWSGERTQRETQRLVAQLTKRHRMAL